MQTLYHLDITLKPKELQPGSIWCLRYSKDHPGNFHRIIFKEGVILFVNEGEFKFRYGNTTFILGRWQFASFRKNMMIEPEYTAETGACILIVLKRDWLREFAQTARLTPVKPGVGGPVTISEISPKLLVYITSLNDYLQDEDNIAGNLARIKALELLYWLSKNDPAIFQHLLDTGTDFHTCITAVVEENMLNNLSIKDLARLSGRSVSSFRREFQAIYNQLPTEWIRQKRLEKAQELLTATSMTVTEICYILGFETVQHFSRLYKSRFGSPPSKQRGKADHLPGR